MSGLDLDLRPFYKIMFGGTLILCLLAIGTAFLKKQIRQKIRARANKKWLEQVRSLEEIQCLTPQQFENFIAGLFEKMGYKTTVTRYSKD